MLTLHAFVPLPYSDDVSSIAGTFWAPHNALLFILTHPGVAVVSRRLCLDRV